MRKVRRGTDSTEKKEENAEHAEMHFSGNRKATNIDTPSRMCIPLKNGKYIWEKRV